jgi:hypothetical protein
LFGFSQCSGAAISESNDAIGQLVKPFEEDLVAVGSDKPLQELRDRFWEQHLSKQVRHGHAPALDKQKMKRGLGFRRERAGQPTEAPERVALNLR